MKKIIFVLSLIFQLLMIEPVFAQSPIGDNIHTEVYAFIQQDLINSKSWLEADVAKLREQEIANQHNKDLKPHIADIYEGELSGLLRILCQVQPHCEEITLYQKNGISIATSGLKNRIKFKTPRNIDFMIGVLEAKTIQGFKVYDLQANNNQLYHEYLFAIYKNKKNNYAYLGTKNKTPDDALIGYVSYVMHEKAAPTLN